MFTLSLTISQQSGFARVPMRCRLATRSPVAVPLTSIPCHPTMSQNDSELTINSKVQVIRPGCSARRRTDAGPARRWQRDAAFRVRRV